MSFDNDKIDQYWAADAQDVCVTELLARTGDFYEYLNETGLMSLWRAVHLQYYHATDVGAYGTSAGEWNELQTTNINDFRNLIQHKIGIVIAQKPTWEPMSINSDIESLAQTKLARSLLEYYQDAKRLSVKANNWVLNAALFGEGFLLQTWDAAAGNVTFANKDEDGFQNVFHEGDVDQRVFEPVDIIRDINIMDSEQNHWYMVREVHNKWDLASKYPEHAEELVKQTLVRNPRQHYISFMQGDVQAKDLVYLYRFFHKKTASVPGGRVVEFVNSDIVLRDGDLPYADFPIHRIIDNEIKGRNFAYTDAYDMLEVQGLSDGLWSTVLTNLNTFGVQNVLMPEGAKISTSDIGGGMNIIRFNPNDGPPPQALQLTAQPQGIFDAINALGAKLETISGVNSTARGNPPAAVGSGVALSMLQSLNVQYAQGLQSSYVSGMEQVGTTLVNILKNYAETPRVIAIVGQAQGSYLKEFSGKDIDKIHRVSVKLGNPMSNTPQGRFSMGQMLVQAGLISDASQLLTVFETGSLDALTEGRDAQLLLSKQIVEALRQGQPVPPPVITDDHALMIRALADLTSDLSLRMNHPELLPPIFTQIQSHMKFLQDPTVSILMGALGQKPLPPNQPQPTQGAPGQPAGIDMSTNITQPTPAVNKVGQAMTATAQSGPQQGAVMNQPAAPQATPLT